MDDMIWNFDYQDEQQELDEWMAELEADFEQWYEEEIFGDGLFDDMNL